MEIRERRVALSRSARNLLLIADESRTGTEWLAMVAGTTAADLQALVAAGLLEQASALRGSAPAPTPAPAAGTAAAPTAAESAEAAADIDQVPFRPLYDYLTAQARPRLGLLQGYRAVLEIERCSGPEALRQYALHFVDQVRRAQGEAAAREVLREIGALAA